MSQWLTIELPDETYSVLRERAERAGTTPSALLAADVQWWYRPSLGIPRPPDTRTEEEKQAAREQLRRLIGSFSSGRPTGADNEQIDADLAREYGDNHENE
jgi:hypothetical protein